MKSIEIAFIILCPVFFGLIAAMILYVETFPLLPISECLKIRQYHLIHYGFTLNLFMGLNQVHAINAAHLAKMGASGHGDVFLQMNVPLSTRCRVIACFSKPATFMRV
jgi:hypothetical protein